MRAIKPSSLWASGYGRRRVSGNSPDYPAVDDSPPPGRDGDSQGNLPTAGIGADVGTGLDEFRHKSGTVPLFGVVYRFPERAIKYHYPRSGVLVVVECAQ